jgi:hypothetical protein
MGPHKSCRPHPAAGYWLRTRSWLWGGLRGNPVRGGDLSLVPIASRNYLRHKPGSLIFAIACGAMGNDLVVQTSRVGLAGLRAFLQTF